MSRDNRANTLIAVTVSAAAATIVVNSISETGGFGCPSVKCTLRDAISAAESNGQNDVIILQNGVTYTLTTAFASNNGLPKITTQVRIVGNGAIIERLSSSSFFRFFTIDPGGDLTLENLTLRGGQPNDQGGAIFNSGKLAVINSVIENNKGGNMGGAIYNEYASVRIERSTLRNNTAQHGGGLASIGGNGSSISLNKFSQLTILNSSIVRNRATAGWGGGIYLSYAHNVDINDSTFSLNQAKQDGGGIMFATLARADAQGVAFVVSLRNVTITNNTASTSAGGLCYSICGATSCPDPTIPVITNTILANNYAASHKDYTVNLSNMLKSGGNNIIGAGNVPFDLGGVTGDHLLGATPLPNLGYLTDTGDAGGEHVRPLAGCMAIDGVLSGFSSAVDQLGLMRVGKADIGAIEYRACTAPPSDMSAWWTFDKDYTLEDMATWTALNFATPVSAAPTQTAGMVAGAVGFTSAGQVLTVPSQDDINFYGDCSADWSTNFTIDAWVKTGAMGVQPILDKREQQSNGTLRGYHLFTYNGQLGLQLAGGQTGYTNYLTPTAANGGIDLSDNRWHFVAVTVMGPCRTINGSVWEGRMYIDGQLAQTFRPLNGEYGNNAALRLGGHSFSSASFFNGSLDEIEIFKRALTAAEVVGLYNAGWAGKCGKKVPPSDGCNPSCQ